MSARSDQDFELELRALPGVVSMSVRRDDDGHATSVTIHDAGAALEVTRARAREILGLYYPRAELVVEAMNLAVATPRPARVALERADYLDAEATSEVSLLWGGQRGVGRANSGPVIGGAQATLAALRDAGCAVPFDVWSANAVAVASHWPVVVILRAHESRRELIGIASAPHEIWSAARATMNALNRYLEGRNAA